MVVAATASVFAPVGGHDFIRFDDPDYVVGNPHVNSGLSWQNAQWAFRSGEQGNWHPLTWLSHMLDVELFGLDAGAHHLVSVGLHTAGAVLLLRLLMVTTGARWKSVAVAVLFALHPTRVESVAWIAERKDVLSGVLWSGTLLAYVAYARSPSLPRYGLLAATFAVGLMAKPMVITLPIVLLLLDIWPLRRAGGWTRAAWRPLVVEKLPLFAMSLAASIATLIVQQGGGAVRSLDALPVGRRIATALDGAAVSALPNRADAVATVSRWWMMVGVAPTCVCRDARFVAWSRRPAA